MELSAGRIIAERYRLEHKLAAGGMGEVWVATHLLLDTKVAVKFMSEEARATARGRFEREAKAAARLSSPHIVRVFDYGFDDEAPFLAMDLLSGESLEAKLTREGPLPLATCAALLGQLAKGLDAAHAAGIIHRDIKPANLFLARSGGEEIVKILDFGIAKETRHSLVDEKTKSGMMLGSPHHMSPEQARGGDVDARSDLWSVAVVLFRMLTGVRPFAGVNVGDVIAKICSDELPRPSAHNSALPPSVDEFFKRAFARNPALRFVSAPELARAFEQAILPEGSAALAAPLGAATTLREGAPQPHPFGADGAPQIALAGEVRGRDEATVDVAAEANIAAARTSQVTLVEPRSEATAAPLIATPSHEQGVTTPVPAVESGRSRARGIALAVAVALGVSGGYFAFTSQPEAPASLAGSTSTSLRDGAPSQASAAARPGDPIVTSAARSEPTVSPVDAAATTARDGAAQARPFDSSASASVAEGAKPAVSSSSTSDVRGGRGAATVARPPITATPTTTSKPRGGSSNNPFF